MNYPTRLYVPLGENVLQITVTDNGSVKPEDILAFKKYCRLFGAALEARCEIEADAENS